MIAATIIAKNPKKFGFNNIPYLPPLKYDKVKVDEPTSLVAVAQACNVPREEVQELNPELRRGVTHPDSPSYTLKIPTGSLGIFFKNISIARIEHPAVAARPIRVAKTSYRRHSEGKESQRHRKVSRSKSKRSSKKYIAKSRKKSKVYVARAKKSKSRHIKSKGSSSPQLASILGVTGSSMPKSKNNYQRNGNKKARSTHLAKRSGSGKASSKGKTSSKNKRHKNKVSKSRSSGSILISKAR